MRIAVGSSEMTVSVLDAYYKRCETLNPKLVGHLFWGKFIISDAALLFHLAPADVVLLRNIDLAKLALYEQARDSSIDLLKNG